MVTIVQFVDSGISGVPAQVLEKEVKKDGPAAVPIRDKTFGSLILGHLDHLDKKEAIWGGQSPTPNHGYMAREFGDPKLSAMTARRFTN